MTTEATIEVKNGKGTDETMETAVLGQNPVYTASQAVAAEYMATQVDDLAMYRSVRDRLRAKRGQILKDDEKRHAEFVRVDAEQHAEAIRQIAEIDKELGIEAAPLSKPVMPTVIKTMPLRIPAAKTPVRKPGTSKGGRLARRSIEDVDATLAKIVTEVKKHADGLRAEEIRAALAIDRRELPRVLARGLETKALKAKGQKRAKTYSAKG